MNYKILFENLLKRCDDLAFKNITLQNKLDSAKGELIIYRIGLLIIIVGVIILYALTV